MPFPKSRNNGYLLILPKDKEVCVISRKLYEHQPVSIMLTQQLTEPISHIPATLVKETIDGRPFYYPNFRKVLTGEQTLDDVMGSSTLQSFIVSFLFRL